MDRQCGILLHPTSLPSTFGIGDLGTAAYRFVDFLYHSGQKLWQVLPLHPVGFGESPYQGLSAFAGNPLLISLEGLQEWGLLTAEDLKPLPNCSETKVDFPQVKLYKEQLLRKAFARFDKAHAKQYDEFRQANQYWLDDFALYMALKEYHHYQPWNCWPREIANRKSEAISRYQELLSDRVEYHIFLQYIFYQQWSKLKNYANSRGIKIIGDLPIYVAYDSSDTWSKPHLFKLDDQGYPKVVAGVPPDYFSPTGQLWGNPIYNWPEMQRDNYHWWTQRFKYLLQITDIIRIDHFRGFESYWEIPFGEQTAVKGRWVKGPGTQLFSAVKNQLGDLPIIAEDLGLITPEVEELKRQLAFPGMKVLQFTLESNRVQDFSPYHYPYHTVIYTGTHDNDTTVGWLRGKLADQQVKENLSQYFHIDIHQPIERICWRLIEIAYQSPVATVIIPMQDILALDSWARMNTPATVGGNNWCWKLKSTDLTAELESTLRKHAIFYNRSRELAP